MAQISIKIFMYHLGILFEAVLCWFAYILVKFSNGFTIDFDYREHETIIFCTVLVFGGRMVLMVVDYEKKRIEINSKRTDLKIKEEELRKLKLENDILENKKTPLN